MSEELKKYFFHYRWLAVIIVFVLFKLAASLLTPFSTDDTIEQNKSEYSRYLSEFGEKLTPEKEQAILGEFDRINAAASETNAVRERFLKGEISSAEFAERINELSQITSREDVFLKAFEQYEYAAQDIGRRENNIHLRLAEAADQRKPRPAACIADSAALLADLCP